MVKIIYLFLKPSKILLFLPLIFLVIVLVGLFSDISDITSFISGASTGIYASLFWFVYLQSSKNNGPFMNQSLLFSLPIDRKKLIKPWFIINQCSFFLIFLTLILGLLTLDIFSISKKVDTVSYLSMVILALVSNILFSLQTPLSFSPTLKKNIILSILLFCAGLFLIPYSQILLNEVIKRLGLRLAYLALILIAYVVTTFLTYRKSLKLI